MVTSGRSQGQYSSRQVADLAHLSVEQLRRLVDAGLLSPTPGPDGEPRFSFQDLVFLRSAGELKEARVPPRRLQRALTRLKGQLHRGTSLSRVSLEPQGAALVASDGVTRWVPESGQVLLDFGAGGRRAAVTPLGRPVVEQGLTAAEWYERGCDLEDQDPRLARDAYARALMADPDHADAHLNLGRLLHLVGDAPGAERHYREALRIRPDDPTAAFNLGIALEDQRNWPEAIDAYRAAIAADPAFGDAHYNLARLCEQQGDKTSALRHLKDYKRLVGR